MDEQMSLDDLGLDDLGTPTSPPPTPSPLPTAHPGRPRYSAREAAERVEIRLTGKSPTTRHDTIRRRCQDLEENLGLLRAVSTSGPRTIYEMSEDGADAALALARGGRPSIAWRPEALVRARDRQPSHRGVTVLRPDKDFHNLLRVFAGVW